MTNAAPDHVDVLSPDQVHAWHRDGYLLLAEALTAEMLVGLRTVVEAWVEESRGHTEPYGVTIDGRPRFDIEPGHCADAPALRRVASPVEVAPEFLDAMNNSIAADAVAQLIGPSIKHHNSKLNSKLPGAATAVKYHQDFLFQPYSNEDLIAVLFFVDEVTLENGPLEVVPGSHRGPLYDHWHDGVFTGSVAPDVAEAAQTAAVACTGPAGTACLMHTRLVHGSAANRAASPRTLFIAEYCADDSVPLDRAHLPTRFEGDLIRGPRTHRIRSTPFEMWIPEFPASASFFHQQAANANS